VVPPAPSRRAAGLCVSASANDPSIPSLYILAQLLMDRYLHVYTVFAPVPVGSIVISTQVCCSLISSWPHVWVTSDAQAAPFQWEEAMSLRLYVMPHGCARIALCQMRAMSSMIKYFMSTLPAKHFPPYMSYPSMCVL
jgi:hypothetical protein